MKQPLPVVWSKTIKIGEDKALVFSILEQDTDRVFIVAFAERNLRRPYYYSYYKPKKSIALPIALLWLSASLYIYLKIISN